jgi:23S rRNA (pseudouridine1915-N3)-methyltransferase
MNKINIICVGKKTSTQLESLIKEYEKRLRPYVEINWQILSGFEGKMSPDVLKNLESNKIITKLNSKFTILLDETGEELDNIQLSNLVNDKLIQNSEINIVIGGSYGVSADLKNKSNLILSLSKLVFPHQIVRLLIIEQLYRSYSITNNLPYHHE